MSSNIFKNRIGSNLNRKKLTIVSQTANEMIVDVERADSVEVGNEGTSISASTFNLFEDRISTVESNSSVAYNNSNTALLSSSSADTKATTALSNSQQALSIANNAYSTVQTLENQIGERGAIVKINNVAQTEINFSSDPQTQINNKTTLSEVLNSIYPIGAVYISTNNTSPALLFGGTWSQIAQGRTLFGEGTLSNITYNLGDLKAAGLPNITAYMKNSRSFMGETNNEVTTSGAFSHLLSSGGGYQNLSWGGVCRYSELWFNASSSNSIYGSSTTVQPNALVVKIWERID